MKFEFSRNFLMGLALAGLMTSCGGSGSWVDSPDDWAQAPMPGTVSAPAKPEKTPEAPQAPTPEVSVQAEAPAQAPIETAAEEAPAEPKKWSWWQKKEKPEEQAPAPEVANNEPVAAPAATAPAAAPAPAEAAGEAKPKRSLWDVMSGKNKAPKEEKAVAENAPEAAPVEKVEAAPAVKNNGDYPTAERVKYNKGWVYSPYDSRKINVRGVSSGSLVADPRYPLDQKKYFRVP